MYELDGQESSILIRDAVPYGQTVPEVSFDIDQGEVGEDEEEDKEKDEEDEEVFVCEHLENSSWRTIESCFVPDSEIWN